jgi:hypothetical protein
LLKLGVATAFKLPWKVMVMPDWLGIVGKSFTADGFDAYCRDLRWDCWRPSFIVLHHTESLSLARCPKGITRNRILQMESYYRDILQWKSGPHLFVDDRQIWVFTPLNVSGTHSPSWNRISLGVAMLGNYDKEFFHTGRGLEVRKNTVSALASLCAALEIDCRTLLLHREDPSTKNSCPGRNVQSSCLAQEVRNLMNR